MKFIANVGRTVESEPFICFGNTSCCVFSDMQCLVVLVFRQYSSVCFVEYTGVLCEIIKSVDC